MKLIKLTNHIYYSENDPATDRPVLGYIGGELRQVMVDAGNSASHALAFLGLLDAVQLRTPDACVITHWHWDHTFGLHALPMETYAHPKTNEKLRELARWEWTDRAMRERLETGMEIPFADEHIRAEYSDVTQIKVIPASHTIEESLVLDCGGITCRCLHLPSAHSDDSIVVYVPEERVIFIGDIYGDDYYNRHHRDLEKTRDLWGALDRLDFTIAVPGHGAPLAKGKLMGFLEERCGGLGESSPEQ